MFFPIESMSVAANVCNFRQQRFGRVMGVRRERMERHSCHKLLQFRLRQQRQRRLADAGAVGGGGLADLRTHAHRLPTFDLVDIDDFGFPEDTEMHGFSGQLVQFAKMRFGNITKTIA
ncbi:hypothetical protein D3C87_1677440 [compost metagenome]